MLALLNSVDQVIVFVPLVSTGMVTAMELQVASSAGMDMIPWGSLRGSRIKARLLPSSVLRRATRHRRRDQRSEHSLCSRTPYFCPSGGRTM